MPRAVGGNGGASGLESRCGRNQGCQQAHHQSADCKCSQGFVHRRIAALREPDADDGCGPATSPRHIRFDPSRTLSGFEVRHLNHSLHAGLNYSCMAFEVLSQSDNKQRTSCFGYSGNVGPRYPQFVSGLGINHLNLRPGTGSEQPFVGLCIFDGWIEREGAASHIVERRRNQRR